MILNSYCVNIELNKTYLLLQLYYTDKYAIHIIVLFFLNYFIKYIISIASNKLPSCESI
jgi:hypothetical protein